MKAQSLENKALYYLERFSATKQGLRQVLLRKMKREAGAELDTVVARAMIDTLVAKLEESGILNDARFAENRTASLARKGTSSRAIAVKLRLKGVGAQIIADNVKSLDDDTAAAEYARRKRFGQFRNGETTKERMQKDIAAMARAGFSYRVSKKALGEPGKNA